MTTRMTAQRLCRLIADGDAEAVGAAVEAFPRLLTATVERAGQDGWTPLHVAVAESRPGIVRQLVSAGADLGARTEHGDTPLHVALELAPELVPVLVELGADVDAPSAAYLDDADRLAAALDDGGAVDATSAGLDLLSWAALGGAARTAQLLLERGADTDSGALHAAAGAGRREVVGLLLDSGADADRRDAATGRTPLHAAVAAAAGDAAAEIVRLLLDAGADVNATTNDGASALDIARVAAARARGGAADAAGAHDAIAELLVTRGATD
ncbi:ankyrin repeat domain-containing protein [Blastococcus sp. TF02A-30]|uniref:ankyrin repeat domain-containing protein n=1 Tax=Blastococcus sp. TF02A-30 TaxID=2250580 RepID=UPI000DEBDA17|nr:ankyrin repeat domain-containing protein [Blastococcus sp. TF02A-30]RBY86440.1 ankyrin repeat domain-containing protein [Blastococcus sp. TF02A-30]